MKVTNLHWKDNIPIKQSLNKEMTKIISYVFYIVGLKYLLTPIGKTERLTLSFHTLSPSLCTSHTSLYRHTGADALSLQCQLTFQNKDTQ